MAPTKRERRVPIRSCAGCGRSAPKAQLVRFGAAAGDLVLAVRGSGRGAYTCDRVECFELACSRRAFARTLRTPVTVDPSLTRLYTEQAHG